MYGRDSDLRFLERDSKDHNLPKAVREQAAQAHRKITEQMKDKKLMGMREKLISAARAGDAKGVDVMTKQMKAHEGQDIETGL